MRTALLLLTSLFTVTLAACTADKDDTDTAATAATTTAVTATDGTSGSGTTAGETTAEQPTTGVASTTDATTGGSELSCDSYCEIYATACKDFSEYDNTEACKAQCAQWPIGEVNATDGDSLACRTYHVTVASTTDPGVHCPHAGPSGATVCADPAAPTCDAYCTKYFANCTADLNLYTDMADCMTQCAEWYPGKENDAAGDSVGCRLYHAGAALADAPLHCPHAGPGGADVCVTM